jgi:hypothetical protein
MLKEKVFKISIAFSIIVAFSIFIEFSIPLLIIALLAFILFFFFPTSPAYLLTFIFIFSQEIPFKNLGIALQVPTEPFIVILGGVWVIHQIFKEGRTTSENKLFNIAVLFFLSAMFLATITSSHVFVSLKLFLNTAGYLLVCVYWTKEILNTKTKIILYVLLKKENLNCQNCCL